MSKFFNLKSKSGSLDELRTQIANGWVHSKCSDKDSEFLPAGTIIDLVSKRNHQLILRSLDIKEHDELFRFVTTNGKKLFIIAVSVKIPGPLIKSGLKHFMKSSPKIDDESLPLSSKQIESVWNGADRKDFESRQWRLLAPIFSEVFTTYTECILPFTSMQRIGSGSFGVVYKCGIHPDHLSGLSNNGVSLFAVKEIHPTSLARSAATGPDHGAEATMLLRMNELKADHIVRFFTSFAKGDVHYLIFEFARGGNLRQLWERHRDLTQLTPGRIRWAVDQLYGLARALMLAHYPEYAKADLDKRPESPQSGKSSELHFRHTDLKPENILCMIPDKLHSEDESSIVETTLKIGDWGSAKENEITTMLRTRPTSNPGGTKMYQAPEESSTDSNSLLLRTQHVSGGKSRSRLYDVWAMGCLALEFLIWLAYGYDELTMFSRNLAGHRFYEERSGRTNINPSVKKMMKRLKADFNGTALGEVLSLIQGHLIVVALPSGLGDADKHRDKSKTREITSTRATQDITKPTIKIEAPPEEKINSPLPSTPTRCKSIYFKEEMFRIKQNVAKRSDSESYLQKGIKEYERSQPPQSANGAQFLDTSAAGNKTTQGDYGRIIQDKWDHNPDHHFINFFCSRTHLPNHISRVTPAPPTVRLCHDCQEMRDRIFKPSFKKRYETSQLQAGPLEGSCDLCSFLSKCVRRQSLFNAQYIEIEGDGSFIRLSGSQMPMINIYQHDVLALLSSESLRPPEYPATLRKTEGENENLWNLARNWLQYCDSEHDHTIRSQITPGTSSESASPEFIPTRLIDVGGSNEHYVFLRKREDLVVGKGVSWLALSHQWGNPKIHEQFRTTVDNQHKYFTRGIRMCDLAATFRDAVKVTRALGCRYLWIDSLCIVQGPGGDFNEEAKNMERVYSGAYCVLAASRAPGHHAGFLQPRLQEPELMLGPTAGSQAFLLRESIDRFDSHVLRGSLQKRAWVLQEHALASRTIYFTDFQVYFECGDGVRCESLTRMTNENASFLGDSNFPESIKNADRGQKILQYQKLYERYSSLDLTNPRDRPVAIDGLQQRITQALRVHGAFGVFDEEKHSARGRGLLRRSLLWCRSDNTSNLERIQFSMADAVTNVPSWSWMAYTGGISYRLQPGFGTTDWEELGSLRPWTNDKGTNKMLLGNVCEYGTIDLVVDFAQYVLVWDRPAEALQKQTRCVVLGRERKQVGADASANETKHYVLIVRVTAQPHIGDFAVYERVGAGVLPGRCIQDANGKGWIC